MADEAAEPMELEETIKDITLDGYTFKADMDLLDDVDAFAIIDRIENKGQVAAIVPLLNFLVGQEEVAKLKAHFTEKDAGEHKGQKDYKARFRIEKLNDVYMAIIEQYDPKG